MRDRLVAGHADAARAAARPRRAVSGVGTAPACTARSYRGVRALSAPSTRFQRPSCPPGDAAAPTGPNRAAALLTAAGRNWPSEAPIFQPRQGIRPWQNPSSAPSACAAVAARSSTTSTRTRSSARSAAPCSSRRPTARRARRPEAAAPRPAPVEEAVVPETAEVEFVSLEEADAESRGARRRRRSRAEEDDEDIEIDETSTTPPSSRSRGRRGRGRHRHHRRRARTRRRPELGIAVISGQRRCTASPSAICESLIADDCCLIPGWGHSSVGRALEWHSRGRRFNSAWLHQPSADEVFNFGRVRPRTVADAS